MKECVGVDAAVLQQDNNNSVLWKQNAIQIYTVTEISEKRRQKEGP